MSASRGDADIGSRSTGASRKSGSQRLSLKVDAHGQIVCFPELPVMGQAILDRNGSEMDTDPTTDKRRFCRHAKAKSEFRNDDVFGAEIPFQGRQELFGASCIQSRPRPPGCIRTADCQGQGQWFSCGTDARGGRIGKQECDRIPRCDRTGDTGIKSRHRRLTVPLDTEHLDPEAEASRPCAASGDRRSKGKGSFIVPPEPQGGHREGNGN